MSFLVALAVGGCGKLGGTPNFGIPLQGTIIAAPNVLTLNGWSGPQTIDVGTVANADANNDVSSSCMMMTVGGVSSPNFHPLGCMQNPAAVFTDSRFMFGFTQNYIPQLDAEPRDTLFDVMMSPVSHSFSGGLSVIDPARGLFPWPQAPSLPLGPANSPMQTSTRYPRYATWTNGNAIAVYEVELPVVPGFSPPNAPANGNAPFGSGLGTFSVGVQGKYSYTRVIYASFYNATRHQWQTPVKLGTATAPVPPSALFTSANQTDFGVDFGEDVVDGPLSAAPIIPYITGNYANFCRPGVATAGDGTAMAVWCEQPQTGTAANGLLAAPEPLSQIRYARYVNGAWQPSKWLIDSPPNGNNTTIPTLANPYFAGRNNDVGDTLQAGLTFATGFTFGAMSPASPSSFPVILGAQVTGVDADPTPSQYLISRDVGGHVLGCETLQSMVTAMLAQPVQEYWKVPSAANPPVTLTLPRPPTQSSGSPASAFYFGPPGFGVAGRTPLPTQTLSQLGISMVVNPPCSGTVTTGCCSDLDTTTWNVSTYYNRALNNTFGNPDATYIDVLPYSNLALGGLVAGPPANATVNSQFSSNGLIVPIDLQFIVVGNPQDITLPLGLFQVPGPASAPSSILPLPNPQEDWIRSAAVDVAGDAHGNYAVVRTAVQPFFQDNDITLTGIGKARGLVGHQFSASQNNWVQRGSKPAGDTLNEPALDFVSSGVTCQAPGSGGNTIPGQYVPCSVRNPKFLMSSAGKGMILFYQNQFTLPSAVSTGTPNRLWWAEYSPGTGFGSTAQILDNDTTCLGTSQGNDASVCEAAAFLDTLIPSGLPNLHCQNVGEPSSRTTEPMFSTLTHDISPIAAAMNPSGQAVVAYTKPVQLATSPPTCGGIGLFTMTFDPNNGWSGVTQVDQDLTVFDPIRSVDTGPGDAMHPSVFITPQGTAGVTWESVVKPSGASAASGFQSTTGVGYCTTPGPAGSTGGSAVGVYFATKTASGTWSEPQLVNSSATGPLGQSATGTACVNHMMPHDSTMPSIALNDNNELVVTYSYSPFGSAGELSPRRQFVNHYFVPPSGN